MCAFRLVGPIVAIVHILLCLIPVDIPEIRTIGCLQQFAMRRTFYFGTAVVAVSTIKA
jgi:hypothetical protein